MRTKSYGSKRRKIQNLIVNNDDWISGLSDDLLQTILSKVSTKEAVKTSVLSKRWVGLWRWRPNLVLDMKHVMGEMCPKHLEQISTVWAKSMTKAMNNHYGNLESCTIHHYPYQSADGTLESWIKTATRVKHTKSLILVNYRCMRPNYGYSVLHIAPKTFSYQSLTSLSLCQFKVLGTHHGFDKCLNLKTLKLVNITVEVSVISRILAACSSLEMLLLQIISVRRHGVLKIENKNLKYLQVATPGKVDGIEVNATGLVVLDMRSVWCERDSFILQAPYVLFNRDYWLACGSSPHLSCNVSHLAKGGRKSYWLELMPRGFKEMRRFGSLSVSVDATNPKEVEILEEVLFMWCSGEMKELEIVFKNNNPTREEGICCINGRERKDFWEGAKSFGNSHFRVRTVWIYNFSGSDSYEFALASSFVRRKIVTEKMMIETSSLFPPRKKFEAEIAKVDLKVLSKGNISIQSF